MTVLEAPVPTSGRPVRGPVSGAGDVQVPVGVMSAAGFGGLVSSLLGGLDFGAMGSVERSDWLRAFSGVDGAVAASRSRALAAGQAVSPRRFLERSAEMVRTTGMSTIDACQVINLADTLDEMPETADALAAGEITTGHAIALSRGVSILNRSAAEGAPSLLAAARSLGVDEFKATVAVFESEANNDTDGSRLASRQHRDRKASWYTKANGMVHLDADLAPDVGSILTGAIHAWFEHLWRTEDSRTGGTDAPDGGRTTRQRNADAIVEIARRFNQPVGGADTTSEAGRTRVDVLIAIDYDSLTTRLATRLATGQVTGSGLCATIDGDTLAPTTIRRLACDAGIIPMVLGSSGEVLDMGRRTRSISTALRNALIIRDRGCTFPGCDLSPSWCDGHHLHHWSDGGPTNLANLALLCSTHHHIVHEDRWSLTRAPDGTLDFTTPTGSKLEARVGNSGEDPP